MKRSLTGAIVVVALLSGAPAGVAGANSVASANSSVSAVNADQGSLVWEPCDAKAGGENVPAECTMLAVPENRQDPASRQISLPIIRIKATGGNPAEPIFRFEGGPGKTNQAFDPPARLLERHDIVQVGYRGVDGSVVLDCPEYKDALKGKGNDLFGEESQAAMGAAMAACGTQLRGAGVDLDGYTILEVTEDIEAARLALGYGRISLLSESYGTRVAQIYGQRFPDNLVRSAMIGVNPPGRFIWEPETIDYQIGLYAELCAEDPACSSRTSDLAETIRRVNADMPRRWLLFPIDPGKVKVVAFAQLFHTETAPMAIDAYLAAADGDASGLAFMSFAYNLEVPDLAVWGDMIAKAYSADFDPDRDYQQLGATDSIMGSPIAQLLWPFTDSWSQTQMPEEYRTANPSDVDTLIINGNLDFSTPAENATAELLPLLENGQEVILTDMGHTDDFWTAQPAAAARLLDTYFDSGEVDASGFERQSFSFEASFPSFTVLGKAMIVLPTIIIALLGLVIWRVVVRRRRKKLARSGAPLDATSPRPGAWYPPTAGVVAGVSVAAFALPTWARLPLWAAILVGIGIAVHDYRAERGAQPDSPRSPASISTERNRYIVFSVLLCALLVALWTFTVWWLAAAVAAIGVAVGIADYERRSAAATQPAPSRSAAVG